MADEYEWQALPAKLLANCIFNYNVPPKELSGLSIFLGDRVVILAESGADWYFGHTLTNEAHKGIFPKEYVFITSNDLDIQEPLVDEINSSLKEWNAIMKSKYVNDEAEVKIIEGIINEVTAKRSSLATGKMTENEAKDYRQKIVSKADFLNQLLKLDLVVRDSNGHILPPGSTSAVSLHRHHVETHRKIKDTMQVSKVDKKNLNEPQVTNTFRIMLEVTNFFTSKITEENVDLIISVYEVYDSKELPKPLCENFVIENWKQSANPSEKTKHSVLFEGISKNDIKQLFLICNVVASGNFAKIKDAGKDRPEDVQAMLFRQAIGVAAQDITINFTFRQSRNQQFKGDEKNLCCHFRLGNGADTLDQTFRKLMTVMNEKNTAANIEQNVLQGKITTFIGTETHNNVDWYGGQFVQIAKKLGLPEIIYPSDNRNDLYVIVNSGKFSKGNKLRDRNVEVTLEVCDEKGNPIKGAISSGNIRFISNLSRKHLNF